MSGKDHTNSGPGQGTTYSPLPLQLNDESPDSPKREKEIIRVEGPDDVLRGKGYAYTIRREWIDRTPELLISFITNNSPSGPFRTLLQRNAFQEGINQIVAKLPGVFFFDNGSSTGLANIIGNTLRGLDVFGKHVTLSDATAGGVARQGVLGSLIGFVRQHRDQTEAELQVDDNHEKIVILNTGTEDGNIRLRADIECEVWRSLETAAEGDRKTEMATGMRRKVHFAAVLIQGGIEELIGISIYLRHQVPVVLLEGCGGVADLLAIGLRLSPMLSESQRRQELTKHCLEMFPEYANEPDLARIAVDLHLAVLRLGSVEELSLIAVITPRNLASLDALIVDAMVKASVSTANQINFESNLLLGIKANRPTVIETVLLNRPAWEDMQIPFYAFEQALVLHDRARFVDLFLQQRFAIHEHLTPLKYLRLFQRASQEPFFAENVWTHILGHPFNAPVTESFVTKELNGLILRLTCIKNYIDVGNLAANVYDPESSVPGPQGERLAMNALAVFAALMGDEPLVHLLIKHSHNPIPLALFIEALFRGLSGGINDRATQSLLMQFAGNLSNIVVGLFDAAVKENPSRAKALLVRELPDYNMRTTLRLAYDAKDRSFIAHQAVQEFLDAWYYGFISVKGSYNMTKLLASAIFIFPIDKFLTFPTLMKPEDRERQMGPKELYPRPVTDAEKNEYIARVTRKESQEETYAKKKVTVPFSRKIYNIWNAPAVKFHIHQWSYIAFLVLIAVAIMLPPCRFLGVDIAVFVMVALRFLELSFKAMYDSKSLPNMDENLRAFELIFEGIFMSLFFVYRIFPFRYDYPFAGKIVLSFGVLYYYYRIWDLYYYMDGILGPSIRMIMRSFRFDLVRWLLVTYQLFIATGLIWAAVVQPDWPFTGDDWRKMAYRAIFTLFGAFYYELEYTPGCEATRIDSSLLPLRNVTGAVPPERCWIGDYSDYSCPTVTVWSYFFYLSYYFFVLLGTLLMLGSWIFTRFIDEWAENAVIWKYHRCRLIMDYGVRSSLPPPLSILGYIYNLFKKQTISYVDNQPKTGLHRMMEAEPLLASKRVQTASDASSYWNNLAHRFFKQRELDEAKKTIAVDHETALDAIQYDLDALVKVTEHIIHSPLFRLQSAENLAHTETIVRPA